MKADCFLVIAKVRGGGVRIRRVTQRRPGLSHDEAIVRLRLEIPDDAFTDPLFTVPVERSRIAIAVEVDEV